MVTLVAFWRGMRYDRGEIGCLAGGPALNWDKGKGWATRGSYRPGVGRCEWLPQSFSFPKKPLQILDRHPPRRRLRLAPLAQHRYRLLMGRGIAANVLESEMSQALAGMVTATQGNPATMCAASSLILR